MCEGGLNSGNYDTGLVVWNRGIAIDSVHFYYILLFILLH